MAKQHTGIRIEETDLKKLKYIAWYDRRSFTETLSMAIETHIKEWEKQNSPISPKMIEDAKI